MSAAYPDCNNCRGHGYVLLVPCRDGVPQECAAERVRCGNCAERYRWQGLDRTDQRAWCVWTKTGRKPSRWHDSREAAETEAARLARLHPGKTFIVFEKLVNIRMSET